MGDTPSRVWVDQARRRLTILDSVGLDPRVLEIAQSHVAKLLEGLAALESLDLDGIEPAITYSPIAESDHAV